MVDHGQQCLQSKKLQKGHNCTYALMPCNQRNMDSRGSVKSSAFSQQSLLCDLRKSAYDYPNSSYIYTFSLIIVKLIKLNSNDSLVSSI